MAYPKGLKWKDGCAFDGTYHWFLCQKHGHKRVLAKSVHASEISRAANDHKAIYHSVARKLLPALFQEPNEKARHHDLTLDELLDSFEQHINELTRSKDIQLSTADDVLLYVKLLRSRLPLNCLAASFDKEAALSYVAARRGDETSGGYRIRRELQTLLRAAAAAGISLPWNLKTVKVKIQRRFEKRKMTLADAQRWISHMNEPEATMAFMKLHTAVRDVELFEQRVGDIDWRGKGWFVNLHVKHDGEIRRHYQPLPPEGMERLRSITAGREPEERIFRINGHRVTQNSIQYRLAKASVAAGLACDPRKKCNCGKHCERKPIRTFAFFRHLAITFLVWKLGPYEAQQYIGHASVTMTERYNRPHLFAEIGLAVHENKRVAAQALAEIGRGIVRRPVKAIGAARVVRLSADEP